MMLELNSSSQMEMMVKTGRMLEREMLVEMIIMQLFEMMQNRNHGRDQMTVETEMLFDIDMNPVMQMTLEITMTHGLDMKLDMLMMPEIEMMLNMVMIYEIEMILVIEDILEMWMLLETEICLRS